MPDTPPLLYMYDLSELSGGAHAPKDVQLDICVGTVHPLLGEQNAGTSTLIMSIIPFY